MAISMILMVLVMAPVLRSFELTRRAQAMVDAQDSARIAIEQISREIGESMDVLDYTADPIKLPVYDPNGSGLPDDIYWLPLPYGKIDLIMPKMIAHCNSPDHDDDVPRDFERGDEAMPMCPSGDNSTDVDIRPKLPIEQGNTVVRYFLGLKYNSPHVSDGPPHPGWQSPYGKNVPAEEGNPVVLYRIEFDPNDKSIFSDDPSEAAGQLMDVLRDPKFFYEVNCPKANGGNWSATDGKELWKHWAQKARALGLAKYQDLVAGLNPGGNGIFTALEPTVTFRYAKVDKETFAGVDYGNTLSEFPNAVPTVFRSKFGYWTPNSTAGITQPYGIYVYRYAHVNNDPNGPIDTGNTIVYYTSIGGGNDLVINKSMGGAAPTQVFNISEYMENGFVDYDNMPANTDVGFCFDYGNGLLNFNRGVVNFALNVKPLELDADGIRKINQTFLAQLDVNRNPLPRMYRLPAVAWLSQATIVPGSEVVTGPDMTPGAVAGTPVRYERVPFNLGDAELNQYRIDYRTGDIFFSRIPSQDLPEIGQLTIDYKIQFNKDDDVVQGDYQTKAMINIHLGIRIYDPDSGQPHMVELNNSVKLRNAYR